MTKTILLVDDDADFVELLRRKLESAGYAVIMAFDGREALLKVQTSSPDMILMDLGMPVMDGFEAIRQLKGNAKTRAIPIVVLTGKGERKDIFRAETLGANDFLVKPCDWAAISEAIRRQLG